MKNDRHLYTPACLFVAAAVIALTARGLLAQARFDQFPNWGMAANQGILDDSSLSLVSFSDTGSAFIKSGISSATAQLRYPILPVGQVGVEQTDGSWCLGMQYRDTGAGARVIVTLKSIDHWGGQITTYATFDSDTEIATGENYDTFVNCRLKNPDGSNVVFFNTLGRAYLSMST